MQQTKWIGWSLCKCSSVRQEGGKAISGMEIQNSSQIELDERQWCATGFRQRERSGMRRHMFAVNLHFVLIKTSESSESAINSSMLIFSSRLNEREKTA